MEKQVSIFIKSYRGDFWLLYYALASITRNVSGYNNIILLIPNKDRNDFDTRVLPPRTLIHYINDKEPGWLYQQVCKMNAHKYCHSEYIMFSDSDCIFTRPISLQDYLKDGKPEILYTDWSLVGDARVWREPTEKFLGESVEWETMRRNNQIYWRSTLEAIEKFAPDLEKRVMEAEGGHFSEFNAMSSFAYKNEQDKYRFVNTADWTYVDPVSIQVWSHASKTNGSETHLKEWVRVLETIMLANGIQPPQ